MTGFPYIFTFYSFKGGVGRSMALLNTAYALAGWGKHVLMVDLDLEAPGVSGFLQRHDELAAPEGQHPLDILTLLGEVVSPAKTGARAKQIAKDLPPLSNYIRRIDAAKLKPLAPKLGVTGRLDIVAADMKRDWCRRLAELGLQGIAQDRLLEISSALRLYFKAHRFPHRPYGLEDFEPLEDTPYDYILIDSRTGITEIGGLCVGPLADRLVVLSSLNDQNIEGTLTFLEEAGIKPQTRTAKSEPWDEADLPAESDNPTLGPKPTLVVASPVPNGEIESKRNRLKELERRIGVRPARLSYHPQMALMESVFVRDYKEEYLAREYLELANAITMQVTDHAGQLASRIFRLQQNEKGLAEAVSLALRLAPQQPDIAIPLLMQLGNSFEPANDRDFRVARQLNSTIASVSEFRGSAFNNWGNALSGQAKTKQGAEADRLFAEAGVKYAAALKIKPDKHETLYNWGNALSAQAKIKRGTEAEELFTEAEAKYAEALKIKADSHEALNNWGNVLLDQAKTKQGAEADRLFTEAGAKYAEALKIKPDKHEALNNWGNVLLDQAKTKQGAEADRLFTEAGAKYAEALKIKPDKHEALNNWGNVLLDQAKTKQGAEADRLFTEAGAKYAEALKIKPDFCEALNNWGNALLTHARTKQGEEASRLLTEAGAKYAEALKVKPDSHEALNNWGNMLSDQAKTKQGAEADRLLTEAGAKYAEALKIKPDSHEALNNWGNVLLDQAKTKQGAQADRLLTEAGAKFAEALKIKPDKHEALTNWGATLSDKAKTKQGAEADRLLAEAGAKYAEALKIKPDSHEALANWGATLFVHARTKRGEEADRLLTEAGAKYAEALKIKPDSHEALTNWGATLSDQAKTKQGAQADLLYDQARHKLMEAEAVQEGSAAFNLACLEALLQNANEAIRWLRLRNALGGRTTRKEIAEDNDFALIRTSPSFLAFLETLPKE